MPVSASDSCQLVRSVRSPDMLTNTQIDRMSGHPGWRERRATVLDDRADRWGALPIIVTHATPYSKHEAVFHLDIQRAGPTGVFALSGPGQVSRRTEHKAAGLTSPAL